jgi:hypothetical protein
MKANELFDQLFFAYALRDMNSVYDRLGHIAHLLADMTVPAHAHIDYHATFDSYDDCWSQHAAGWYTFADAGAAGGPIEAPQSAIDWILADDAANGGYGIGAYPTAYAKLFYLMYTAQQTGDYFPSDQYSGDANDRLGWMDYNSDPYPMHLHDFNGEDVGQTIDGLGGNFHNFYCTDYDGDYTTIARTEIVYALRSMAGLFSAFRDTFDRTPPVMDVDITFDNPDVLGWRRGHADISVAVTDDFSGIESVEWGIDRGPDWKIAFSTEERLSASWPNASVIDTDGVNRVFWRARDWFGNRSTEGEAIVAIDNSPPVIIVHTPQDNGAYLTTETLTLDWEVSDRFSGLYSVVAILDGRPVQNGQVLDLSARGGLHTLTITARDLVGNTKTVTTDFSVKLIGTVAFQPNTMSLKNRSPTILTYVELPPGFDVKDIDFDMVRLIVRSSVISAEPSPIRASDFDQDGIADRPFRFDRALVNASVVAVPPQGGFTDPYLVHAVLMGALFDGTEFWSETDVFFTHTPQ